MTKTEIKNDCILSEIRVIVLHFLEEQMIENVEIFDLNLIQTNFNF